MKELSEEEMDNLRLENDIMKLKLTAQFGMIPGHTNECVDPQTEHDFLKYIENFERSYANSKRITVGDKLGHPLYISPDEIKQVQ